VEIGERRALAQGDVLTGKGVGMAQQRGAPVDLPAQLVGGGRGDRTRGVAYLHAKAGRGGSEDGGDAAGRPVVARAVQRGLVVRYYNKKVGWVNLDSAYLLTYVKSSSSSLSTSA